HIVALAEQHRLQQAVDARAHRRRTAREHRAERGLDHRHVSRLRGGHRDRLRPVLVESPAALASPASLGELLGEAAALRLALGGALLGPEIPGREDREDDEPRYEEGHEAAAPG